MNRPKISQQSGPFQELRLYWRIAELRRFWFGDGIFLQSFVLRYFSMVQKSEGTPQQLTVQGSSILNPCRTRESNNSLSRIGRTFEKRPKCMSAFRGKAEVARARLDVSL